MFGTSLVPGVARRRRYSAGLPRPPPPGSPTAAVVAADRWRPRSAAARQTDCPLRCPTRNCPSATAQPSLVASVRARHLERAAQLLLRRGVTHRRFLAIRQEYRNELITAPAIHPKGSA